MPKNEKILYTRAQFATKTEEEWLATNPVLRDGEMVFVKQSDGSKVMKVGNGQDRFSELLYAGISLEELEEIKNSKVDKTDISYSVYGTGAGGTQSNYRVTYAADADRIPVRNSQGQLIAPNQDTYKPDINHYISRQYMEKTTDDHEKRLTNIEKHIAPDYFYTDDNSAYVKTVPDNACPYAQLNDVGGRTYKCTNLIPFPYKDGGAGVKTIAGVTFNIGADGSITANGTSTQAFNFNIADNLQLPAGTYTFSIVGVRNGMNAHIYDIDTKTVIASIYDNNVVSFTIAEAKNIKIYLNEYRGNWAVELNIKPMLNIGSTAFPYEPYFEGLRDAKITAINSYDIANLIPFPYDFKNPSTSANVERSYDEDGTITLNGTASASRTIPVGMFENQDFDGIYTFACEDMPSGANLALVPADGGSVIALNKGTFTINNRKFSNISLNINEGTILNNFKFHPMLVKGDVELKEYKPHQPKCIEYPLPETITSLDGWGKGIEGYTNIYDFENSIYTKRCETTTLNGTENWIALLSRKQTYYCSIKDKKIGYKTSLCSDFNNIDAAWVASKGNIGDYSDNTTNNNVYFVTDCITLEDWKAYLANNPITITYALAEPITQELPVTFDNLIEVEVGGSIEFVNEYKYDVPSSITYLLQEDSI